MFVDGIANVIPSGGSGGVAVRLADIYSLLEQCGFTSDVSIFVGFRFAWQPWGANRPTLHNLWPRRCACCLCDVTLKFIPYLFRFVPP